jgi:FkbM family methyltransferase
VHSIEQAIVGAFRPIRVRGKGRLLSSLLPHIGDRQANVFGCSMNLDLSDWIQRNIYFGTYEREETEIVKRYLRSGMTFVDVGANVGYYTVLAASLVGSTGHVFAFEPSPYAFQRLSQMAERNKLLQVRCFRAGLGEKTGECSLYLGPGNNHSPTMIEHAGLSPMAEAEVLTLDEWVNDWKVSRIDVLKLDIEGWESKLLRGAARLLADRRINSVLCEFNEYWLKEAGSSPKELLAILNEAGFVDSGSKRALGTLETRFFVLDG